LRVAAACTLLQMLRVTTAYALLQWRHVAGTLRRSNHVRQRRVVDDPLGRAHGRRLLLLLRPLVVTPALLLVVRRRGRSRGRRLHRRHLFNVRVHVDLGLGPLAVRPAVGRDELVVPRAPYLHLGGPQVPVARRRAVVGRGRHRVFDAADGFTAVGRQRHHRRGRFDLHHFRVRAADRPQRPHHSRGHQDRPNP